MTDKAFMRILGQCAVAAAFCLSLPGCGGGGDTPAASAVPIGGGGSVAPLPLPVGATTTQTPPVVTPPPAGTAPTVAVAVVDVSCGLNGAAGIQAEVLQRVNAVRASGAVCGGTPFAATTALVWNSALLQAASGHSNDMAQKNYFSHTSLDGRTADQRVTAAGYIWSNFGENIAAGQTSVEQVMNGWISSSGHCQNLMNPNFRDVAVACVRNNAADYRVYWTMELARSR